MKRITIILMALMALTFLSAQEKENAVFLPKKNEVNLNFVPSIFGSFPEVSYERILEEDISVGLSLGVSLDDDNDYTDMKFEFLPYFRWFFGGSSASMQKYAGGFFIEANTGLLLIEEYASDGLCYDGPEDPIKIPIHVPNSDDKLRFGLGVALGWKYITKNNWVGEIYLGAGKTFGGDSDAYPRLGITIGKRF